jgi:hypothetical protein
MFGRYRNYSSYTGINEYLPEKEPFENTSETEKEEQLKKEEKKEETKKDIKNVEDTTEKKT